MATIQLNSFDDLFSKDNLFRIPNYQRGYAWQLSQVNDFWNDLINLNPEKNHYTGMITIQKKGKNDWKKLDEDLWFLEEPNHRMYHIIDGQQRITTFILLIDSMIKYANECGYTDINSEKIEDIYSKYICRKDKHGLPSYIFGYEVDNPSFKYLKYRIFEDKQQESVDESYYTNNLENAKIYFTDQLKNYCANDKNRLDLLYLKITRHMQFIEFEIKPAINVFVAFETMNNRGKKLSNLELLKNRLIYLVTLFDDNGGLKYKKERVIKTINEKWGIIYKWLGQKKDKPLDDDEFLRNQWILFFGKTRTTGDLYVKNLLNEYFTVSSVLGNETYNEAFNEPIDSCEDDYSTEAQGEYQEDISDNKGKT